MRRMRALQRHRRATRADVTPALITEGRDHTPAADIRQLTIVPISSTKRSLASSRRREVTRTLRLRAIDRRRSPATHHRLVIRRRNLVIRRAQAAARLTGNCPEGAGRKIPVGAALYSDRRRGLAMGAAPERPSGAAAFSAINRSLFAGMKPAAAPPGEMKAGILARPGAGALGVKDALRRAVGAIATSR